MTFVRRGGVLTGRRAGPGTVVEGAVLEGCEIFDCRVDLPADPAERPVFRDITMIDNIVQPMAFDGAVIEDALIDGIRCLGTRNLLVVGCCAFRRVTLRGRFEAMNVVDTMGVSRPADLESVYAQANLEYWDELRKAGDWALDISAVTGLFSLRGIPADLVRRDPETQVVVTFEQAFLGQWREVPEIMKTVFRVAIEALLRSGWRDVILITNRERPTFTRDVQILRRLQDMGAAEPD